MADENKEIVDINRQIYDIKDVERAEDFYRIEDGLNEEIVR